VIGQAARKAVGPVGMASRVKKVLWKAGSRGEVAGGMCAWQEGGMGMESRHEACRLTAC